ncbi:hypothetical protein [Agrobacterium sp. NPDC089420]|uniref:hypothetical protein n=1 Tax=Agrobacterium sp. NPDC089420 TaxID=3363918 RepID=UPI00384FF6FD
MAGACPSGTDSAACDGKARLVSLAFVRAGPDQAAGVLPVNTTFNGFWGGSIVGAAQFSVWILYIDFLIYYLFNI